MNILTTTIEVTRQAGDLLARRFNPAGTLAQKKADFSLVTEADLEADRFIEAALQQNHPGTRILSEEKHTRLGAVPDELWIVDPLDGTTNFSLGLHYWGVSIAYLKKGYPEAAAMYFPLLGEMYTCQRGQGARLNDNIIQASPPIRSNTAPFISCCSRTFKHYEVNLPYKTRILGSTAYSWCSVSRGMALASFDVTAKIWDVAGGWLLVQESGGTGGTFQGESIFPILPDVDYAMKNITAISAADSQMFATMRSRILPKQTFMA